MDFIAPHEVFSVAGIISSGDIQTTYVCVDGPGTVRLADGTAFPVEHGWAPDQADIIVVPGSAPAPDGPGVPAEIARGTLPRALAAARGHGRTLASVCTGALLLGAGGLVRGRPCTTHHRVLDQLEAQGGVLKDARVVDDGDLVTAGGITSGLDLALWLVRRELGAGLALSVEATFEYEARGIVWTA
jgi:transcriptional regulator GlxA family with amidase domain